MEIFYFLKQYLRIGSVKDIRNLEAFYEQKIAGFVFPFGTYDESAFRILKECGIQYARTSGDTHGFALQSDLLRFKPSFHHADADIMSGIDRFLKLPHIFLIHQIGRAHV